MEKEGLTMERSEEVGFGGNRFKMATGTYPMGTDHPCPHPPGQNLFNWVTH
jgi:hypothetical protein